MEKSISKGEALLAEILEKYKDQFFGGGILMSIKDKLSTMPEIERKIVLESKKIKDIVIRWLKAYAKVSDNLLNVSICRNRFNSLPRELQEYALTDAEFKEYASAYLSDVLESMNK